MRRITSLFAASLILSFLISSSMGAILPPRYAAGQSPDPIDAGITEPRAKVNATYARGQFWSVKYLGGGQYRWFYEPVWIWSSVDSRYAPYILGDKRSTDGYIQVQAGQVAVRIYDAYTTIYKPDVSTVEVQSEQWFLRHYNPKIGGGVWREAALANLRWNVTKTENYIDITKTWDTLYSTTTGVLEITYHFEETMKHTVRWWNTSSTWMEPRFEQYWTGINADALVTEGASSSSSGVQEVSSEKRFNKNYTGFRFGRSDGSVSVAENQWSAVDVLNYSSVDLSAGGKKARFIFSGFNLSQPITVDPTTYTTDNPTEDGHLYGASETTVAGRYDSQTDLRTGLYSGWYYKAYIEWNVSGIPNDAVITDTVFRYDAFTNTMDDKVYAIQLRPSTADNQDLWNDISNGTIYADVDGFPQTGGNKTLDLGTDADSDLQSNGLSNDWFAIGLHPDSWTNNLWSRLNSEESGSPNPAPTLEVTYTVSSGVELNIQVYAADGSTPASALSTTYISLQNSSGEFKKQVSSGWANYTGLTPNVNVNITAQIYNTTDTNSFVKVNQTNLATINVTANLDRDILLSVYQSVTYSFKRADGTSFTPDYFLFTLGNNGTQVNATSFPFSGVFVNGSNTIVKIQKHGGNVKNSTSSWNVTSDAQPIDISARIYQFALQGRGLSDSTLNDVKFDVTLPNSTDLSGLSADSTGYYTVGYVTNGSMTMTGYWRDAKANVSFTHSLSSDTDPLIFKLQVGKDSSSNFRFTVGSNRLLLEELTSPYQVEPAWILVNNTYYTTGNHTGWAYDSATHILTVTDSGFPQSTTTHDISWNLNQVLLTFNATGSETLFKVSWEGVVQGGGDGGGGGGGDGGGGSDQKPVLIQPFTIDLSPTQYVAWIGETTTLTVKVDWTQVTEIAVNKVEVGGLHREWVKVVTPLPHRTVFSFEGPKVEIALSITVPPDAEPQRISLTLKVTAQSEQGASTTQQQPVEVELKRRGVIQTPQMNIGDYALYGVFILMVALIGGGAFMRGRKTRVKANPKLSRRDIG